MSKTRKAATTASAATPAVEAPILLTKAACLQLLSLSASTFNRLVREGTLPRAHINRGKTLRRWRRDAIEAAVKELGGAKGGPVNASA